jgi:hypothetical protein
MNEFISPCQINQCKLTDRIILSVEDLTPYDPIVQIYDLSNNLITSAIADQEQDGYLYWNIEITDSLFEEQTYYKIVIDDSWPSDYPQKTYYLYVNNDLEMEQYIIRGQGLSGYNIRYFSHVWTNGLLTSFNIKFYASRAAVIAADAGTADDYLGYYQVAISYDANYNPYQITSLRVS